MKTYIIPTLLALLIVVGSWWVVPQGESSNTPLFTAAPPPPEAEVIAERDIVDVAFDGKGTVTYKYLSEDVPRFITVDEVPELRTEKSFTRFKAVQETTDGEEVYTLESVIYPERTFEKEGASWRYIEYATTTEDVWKQRPISFFRKFKELMIPSVYAVVDTIYSGAGDGHVGNFSTGNVGSAWTSARSAASGDYVLDSGTTMLVYADLFEYLGCEPTCQYESDIYRAFVPFDTSSISSSATITAATLNLYAVTVVNGDDDGTDYITVSTSTQATHTTLAVADYNDAYPLTMNTGSEVIDSGQRKDITSITASAYLTFTLNSNGIAAIKKSGQSSTCSATAGITCLALREGHDASGNSIAADLGGNYVYFSTSEQTGTSQDPYLSVTYTVPASAAATGMSIGGTGTLNVRGDGNLRF